MLAITDGMVSERMCKPTCRPFHALRSHYDRCIWGELVGVLVVRVRVVGDGVEVLEELLVSGVEGDGGVG